MNFDIVAIQGGGFQKTTLGKNHRIWSCATLDVKLPLRLVSKNLFNYTLLRCWFTDGSGSQSETLGMWSTNAPLTTNARERKVHLHFYMKKEKESGRKETMKEDRTRNISGKRFQDKQVKISWKMQMLRVIKRIKKGHVLFLDVRRSSRQFKWSGRYSMINYLKSNNSFLRPLSSKNSRTPLLFPSCLPLENFRYSDSAWVLFLYMVPKCFHTIFA